MSEPNMTAQSRFRAETGPVAFGATFVRSEAFRSLFREGMTLVEETAAYLDGPGRAESRLLSRQGGLAYASESMRLTTRLMQIASWLLVQRAVAEGEIASGHAVAEQRRIRLEPQTATAPSAFDALPERLKDLVGASLRLHARLQHLDCLTGDAASAPTPRRNPVALQQWLVRSAFDDER